MKTRLLSLLLFASFAFAEDVKIFPIDRAAIMVGARFDLKVEFPEILTEQDVEIRIAGKTPTEAFGSAGEMITEKYWPRRTAEEKAADEEAAAKTPKGEKPPARPKREASAFILRNCVFHSAVEAVPVTVSVRKDKVAEVTWRVFLPTPQGKQAKNVILMIGDGMSQAHRVAARVMSKGIRQGKYNGMLAMEDMPSMALVGTSGMDSIITDSANSAAAYTSGHKSGNGGLCVYTDRTDDYRAASTSTPADVIDDPAVESIAGLAQRLRGMRIGVVTDAEIQDATPASMYAHVAYRGAFPAITDMLVKSNFDVIFGGGRASFSKTQFAAFAENGYTVVETRTDLLAAGTPSKLFGIFNPRNIDGEWDRKFLKKFKPATATDQPDLTELTATALKMLEPSPNGFVLMIEGARIDKFSHSLDWERAVMDTIQFDKCVELVKDFAKVKDDTLVLVVGDHTHGVSIVGTIENKPPHTVDVAEHDEESGKYVKKTVPKLGRDYVQIYDDAGYPNYEIENGYPKDLNVTRRLAVFFTNFPDYYETFAPKTKGEFKPTLSVSASGKKFNIPNPEYAEAPGAILRTGNISRNAAGSVHTCEDQILTATGPGSEAVHGFIDNTKVFEIMVNALGLREKP